MNYYLSTLLQDPGFYLTNFCYRNLVAEILIHIQQILVEEHCAHKVKSPSKDGANSQSW